MMKFNLSDSFSAIYMDIKRLLHTQSVHNTNVKVLNSSFKNEKKNTLPFWLLFNHANHEINTEVCYVV